MTDIEKAARDAVEAQANTEQVALIQAVLAAQQLTQQQAQPVAPAPVQQSSNVAKWVGVGIGGALALTPLAMAAAMLAIAVGISAVALTICTLVLRSMWVDMQKGKKS
ncbi:hypothetical protein [Streptomyces sp. NPDC018833]|uniref:hypothetical protein n=1 Tax=Streptomyces sp. NPDC018833 TaxID=3365053 RepID=UPI00379B303B